jgi:hypothetical protein
MDPESMTHIVVTNSKVYVQHGAIQFPLCQMIEIDPVLKTMSISDIPPRTGNTKHNIYIIIHKLSLFFRSST